MLWFNSTKDLGVITADDGGRLPVAGDSFADGARPQGRCAGATVSFRVAEGDDGPTAADVEFVTEVAPRRARLRHARGMRS